LRGSLLLAALLILPSAAPAADQLLLTLQVDSTHVRWQEEFLLSLEVYGAPSASPPQVTIDGLDQFQLVGQGKNLLQVPGGKTVKWILTYNLTGSRNGAFKIGPARASAGGRTYTSNTLFVTVEGAPRTEPEKAEPVVTTPRVLSAREIGDKVMLMMEADNPQPFRSEGFIVTLRLLSQLPVENLRFLDEAQFPGFLKYDFPYTDRPRAEHTMRRGEAYASFDLQKFLVFPLSDGDAFLPPFRCEITVRVPSGTYAAADPRFDLERSSNPLRVKAKALPAPVDLVGHFTVSREILSAGSQSGAIRMTAEGDGLLSTFVLPEPKESGFRTRVTGGVTEAALSGNRLRSRKTLEVEIVPDSTTTDIVLPALSFRQFDPHKRAVSTLQVPETRLRFAPPEAKKPEPAPMPVSEDPYTAAAWAPAALSAAAALLVALRPKRRPKTPRLTALFHHRKPHMQIPKNAAQGLYQQIAQRVALRDGSEDSLIETLRLHIPEEEWGGMEDVILRLEYTAFSKSRAAALTYGELKRELERVEKRWLA
jgi:hypothetical protein